MLILHVKTEKKFIQVQKCLLRVYIYKRFSIFCISTIWEFWRIENLSRKLDDILNSGILSGKLISFRQKYLEQNGDNVEKKSFYLTDWPLILKYVKVGAKGSTLVYLYRLQ